MYRLLLLVPIVNCYHFYSFGNNHLRAVWRLSLGLGFIPAMLVFFWRLKMEEPTRYKRDSMRNAKIPYGLVLKRYWKDLAAISSQCLKDLTSILAHRTTCPKQLCGLFTISSCIHSAFTLRVCSPITGHAVYMLIHGAAVVDGITGGDSRLSVVFGWNVVIKFVMQPFIEILLCSL
jgi:hypothetical protein